MNNNKENKYAKIILPECIKVGHCSNSVTGVTVILAEDGAVGGVDVRGCAPGTRETDLLHNEKAIDNVNAVVLAGGSAYGLEASCGVINYLREKGKGYSMNKKVVPLVTSAVIYDLSNETDDYNYPTMQMGYAACVSAENTNVMFGKVGVGTGATVGKIRGVEYSSAGGIGATTISVGALFVTALVAVNAVGDVYDNSNGKIIAGAHDNAGEFLDTFKCVIEGNFARLMYGTNTTIGCVITNAKLNKVQANKLASISHNGLAQSIRPVHTDHDGDTLYALSCGEELCDFTMLEVMAVEAVRRAIIDAVSV